MVWPRVLAPPHQWCSTVLRSKTASVAGVFFKKGLVLEHTVDFRRIRSKDRGSFVFFDKNHFRWACVH